MGVGKKVQVAWSDAVFREALQLIAESVAESAGFEYAAISLVRDDRQLAFVAFVGEVEERESTLEITVPVDALEDHFERSEKWGDFRFVPHDQLKLPDEFIAYQPEEDPGSDDPGAWRPLDNLSAPIYDEQGTLRGLLQVDQPVDGRRPGPEKQAQLQRYAQQTKRAVLTAVQREKVVRRLALADDARRVVRNATGHLGAEAVLRAAGPALMEAFDAQRLWAESLADGESAGGSWLGGDQRWQPTEWALRTSRRYAERLWSEQRVGVLRHDGEIPGMFPADEIERIRAELERSSPAGMMLVPLGVGATCVGYLILSGEGRGEPWKAADRATLLDIGHDLGRALLTARVFSREREVADRLRRLDDYRRSFVRTLAHELKNPLAAIFGHTAMTTQLPLPVQANESMTAIRGAADRMRILIDDLMVLSGLNDPEFPLIPTDLDLAELGRDVVEANRVLASQHSITLDVRTPGSVPFAGAYAELERAVTNLVSNAISYTQSGGRVTLALQETADEVRISVCDNGPGVLPEDRRRLFEDFYRGHNPATHGIPGSGLGLSIVSHVAARHGGRVDVDSEPGHGAEFTLVLPLPTAEGQSDDLAQPGQ